MGALDKLQSFIDDNPSMCEEIRLYHIDKDKWMMTMTWGHGYLGFDDAKGSSLEGVIMDALRIIRTEFKKEKAE